MTFIWAAFSNGSSYGQSNTWKGWTILSCNTHDQYFSHCHGHPQKPIEIYVFIDPLSPDCWLLEPSIKKLKMKYGRFFTLRTVTSSSINALNRKRKSIYWPKHGENLPPKLRPKRTNAVWTNCDFPYLASLALKAAELQGRKFGMKFCVSFKNHFLSPARCH